MRGRSKLHDMMAARGFLSAREVAKRCGHSPSTVYRWVDDGTVEGERVGSQRFVKLSSVIKHLGPAAARMLGLLEPARGAQ